MNEETSRSKVAATTSSKQHQPRKQNTPGLLTLSKPLEKNHAKQITKRKNKSSAGTTLSAQPSGNNSAEQSDASISNPSNVRKKKGPIKSALEAMKFDEDSQLSKSAPSSRDGMQWEMPSKNALETSSALTWQQELLNEGKPIKSKKQVINKKENPSSKKNIANKEPSLTWQQQLFESNKPRGPTFDVFADSKDEQTFGNKPVATIVKKKNHLRERQRADSMGELGKNSASRGNKKNLRHSTIHPTSDGIQSSSSTSNATPSTPNKFAYAGPNFHNSPSPATLPTPKFLQSKGGTENKRTSMHNAQIGSEDEEQEDEDDQQQQQGGGYYHDNSIQQSPYTTLNNSTNRFIRGGTAPPELQTSSNINSENITIENLLAKMMKSGSD